jgi:hypothetical protein
MFSPSFIFILYSYILCIGKCLCCACAYIQKYEGGRDAEEDEIMGRTFSYSYAIGNLGTIRSTHCMCSEKVGTIVSLDCGLDVHLKGPKAKKDQRDTRLNIHITFAIYSLKRSYVLCKFLDLIMLM